LSQVFAVVDVGGTKIAAGLVDAEGELLRREELPTPPTSVEHVVGQLLQRLTTDPRWASVAAIGIGSAGPIDAAKGTVSPVNIPAWRNFPLTAYVADHIAEHVRTHAKAHAGQTAVILAGDGVSMAAGEHWRGAARGRDNVLCMVVSTGVGGGLVLGGRLRSGPSGNAGHIGHICVELEGDECPCGSRGCLETIASGTAIAKYAGEATAAAVAELARAEDPIAIAAFDRAAKALAAGIASTAALVDIEAVVVGGGVAKAGDLLFAPLRRHLDRYARLSFTQGIDVQAAELGADAGLIGAAALVAHRGL
jgi:glucokinase